MKFPFFKKRNWVNLDLFEGRETTSGIHINEAVALGIPAVFACVRVLSEAIAALPLNAFRTATGNGQGAFRFMAFCMTPRIP